MTQNCVESFLEVSLKATSVQRPTTEPEEETEEEALAGRTRVGGGGVGGRRTDCYGADGEIITLNFKQQHHPQKQRDSGPDGGFQEENGGGFANKILTERVRIII